MSSHATATVAEAADVLADLEPRPASARLVGAMTGFAEYVGGILVLLFEALAAPFQKGRAQIGLGAVLVRELECLFVLGFPLVALVHVGMGSFLSMQAFFGATFADTNGAVVGVALMRSVAPMVTGFVLAGLMAVRITVGLGLRSDEDAQVEPDPERELVGGREVLPRVVAGMLAGPVLSLWGAAVGTVIGALLSRKLFGVASGTYFGFFLEMLRVSDVVGVFVLGTAYAGVSALIACQEARRGRRLALRGTSPTSAARLLPAYRATLLSVFAILAINSAWFASIYLSNEPAGPVVATDRGV